MTSPGTPLAPNSPPGGPLGNLLDSHALALLGAALQTLLDESATLLDGDGSVLWGTPAAAPHQETLLLEGKPIGYLLCASSSQAQAAACRELLLMAIRAERRYRQALDEHDCLRHQQAERQTSLAREQQLAQELEERIRAQLAAQEQRQQVLYQAEKLASVGQLAAGMAHEINNPLGFVRSNLSTLGSYLDQFAALKARLHEAPAAWQELELDFLLSDGRELLQDSQAGIERIARIVRDLKSFSNVDQAAAEFADINACIRQVIGMLESQRPSEVSLSLALSTVPPLLCLPGHINQLLFNIIRNAIQAVQDSGHPGEVRISSQFQGGGIEVRISDNGVGMNQEQRERAFEPFFTTRPVGSGTGLGLSTARNIVLAHGGQIKLASALDRGTLVTLFFPVST